MQVSCNKQLWSALTLGFVIGMPTLVIGADSSDAEKNTTSEQDTCSICNCNPINPVTEPEVDKTLVAFCVQCCSVNEPTVNGGHQNGLLPLPPRLPPSYEKISNESGTILIKKMPDPYDYFYEWHPELTHSQTSPESLNKEGLKKEKTDPQILHK